jgi:flagellar biosynthesis/type III secretory pathway protein FliH
MDGSNAAFLLDMPGVSRAMPPAGNGILYMEDFDNAPETVAEMPAPALALPVCTDEDVRSARAEGYAAGVAACVADARLMQAQLQSAALQTLADGLASARAELACIATGHAEATARMMLAILKAAVPAAMRRHACGEMGAMVEALSPGLVCEPELRVRAHPDLADAAREALIGQLPGDGCVLSVCADPALAPGDICVAWQDGRAMRDCGAIWAQIVEALAPLQLPLLEDIDRGD